MRKWTFILLCLAALLGCSRELEPAEVVDPDGEPVAGEKITLKFSVSGDQLGPLTKALGEESPLKTLHLAVFGRSGYLKEYVQATPIPPEKIEDYEYLDLVGDPQSVDQYQFTAELTLTDNYRIVHFVGNGPSVLNFGYADDVLRKLLSDNGETAYWQMRVLENGVRAKKSTSKEDYEDVHGNTVTYGDFIDNDGNLITDGRYVPTEETVRGLQEVPLIRNWAKIVVEKYTEGGNDPYFTPYSYAVINTPTKGSVAPYSSQTKGFIENYEKQSYTDLQDAGYPANLPAGTTFDNTIPSHVDFLNGTNGVTLCSNPNHAVYLYERPKPTEELPPTAVIVYGYYDNPDDPQHSKEYYYYKVDLMVDREYYPVFRNFKYKIQIKKILTQGHHTPEAAASSAGSADVSADINARHLADISDGQGRLIIDPQMAFTFTSPQTDYQRIMVYFINDISSEEDAAFMDGTVTVQALSMPYGEDPLIPEDPEDTPLEERHLWIDPPIPPEDEHGNANANVGWRVIHLTTIDYLPTTPRTQTIRVTGIHENGTLYRDIEITLQNYQKMQVNCVQDAIPNEKGSSLALSVSIPDGLNQSMFPLEFKVEPQAMTLTPDGNKANNNLPVHWGNSIADDASGKQCFYFLRTIDWTEYRSLPLTVDEEDNRLRTFTCYFKSNRDESKTTIWVDNEYFEKDSDSFDNYVMSTFRNLAYTTSIPCAEGKTVGIQFYVRRYATGDHAGEYPWITFSVLEGLIPDPVSSFTLDDETGLYSFQPTADLVQVGFKTTGSSGEVGITLSADQYEDKHLSFYTFKDVWIWEGKRLTKDQRWSNAAFGRVNKDNNKSLLIGYVEDEDMVNTPVSAINLQNLTVISKSNTFPTTPSGPVSYYGEDTYHELELLTVSGTNPVSFTLSSPGYVEKTVTYKRFNGNIFKKNGDAIFTTADLIGKGLKDTQKIVTVSAGSDVKIEFSDFSNVISSEGVIFTGREEPYTITVTPKNTEYSLFFLQLELNVRYDWTGTVTSNPGVVERYPGNRNQIVWRALDSDYSGIPRNFAVQITFTVPEGENLCINGFLPQLYKGTLYN